MPKKRFSVEQIIHHLREAEVLLAQGRTVGRFAVRSAYRSRATIGGGRSTVV